MDDFVSQFEEAYNNPTANHMPGNVTVTCVYGGNTPDNVANCPPGPGQGSCVGGATLRCLNGGGCATSCSTSTAPKTVITITPTSFIASVEKK